MRGGVAFHSVFRLFGSVQNILEHVIGRLFITGETFGEFAPALRHGAQAGRIGQKFRLRRFRRDDLHIVLRIHADDAAAALVQIAHDIADVLFGHGDLEVRERLEQHGGRLTDALFEGDLRRRLERGFRGVDGMETSVIERGAHMDDGIAREHAVRQTLHQPLLNSGDILFGNGAAHNFFHKFEVLFAGLEADLAVAVLPVPARLLLVFALDVRLAANCLAIGDGGRAELGVGAKLCLELLLDDVKVHFALPAYERLARVGIFADGEASVLLGKAIEAAEHLILRAAHARIHRHEEHGFVEGNGIEHDGRALIAQGVARSRVGKFADCADIARTQLGKRLELFAADEIDGADALRRPRVGIEHAHARFEHAAHDAQIVHLAHEGVDGGLEHLRREGPVGIAGNADHRIFDKVGRRLLGAFRRLGQVLDDLVHQIDDALVLQRTARHDGDDVDVEDALADAVDHVLAGQEALFEVLLQQDVVVFRRRLGEGELHLLVVAAIFLGHRDLLGPRVREVIRLPGERVGVARHLLAVHDGDLDGREQRLVFFAERRNCRGIVGILLIHAVDEDDDGFFGAQAQLKRLLGAHRHRAVRTRHNDRRAACTQRLGYLPFEIIETGHVDQVDLDVLPGDGGNGERDAHLARDLLFVKVGDGRAVLHLAHSLDDAAVEQHRFKECGLAFAAVPDDGHVADIFCRNAHILSPYQKLQPPGIVRL